MCNLLYSLLSFPFYHLPPLSKERWRVSASVRLRRPRADRSVEGRAGEQRPLVRHAGGQPAAGPSDLRVHGCLRGQVGVHSDLPGRNRARGTAGPDPPSDSEQDAASRDSECHAGRRRLNRQMSLWNVWKPGLYLLMVQLPSLLD